MSGLKKLFSIKNRKVGFTLAEVLITLGIIGVVAALTMPTIIENHKKKVTVEKLKTAYSIFYQAIESAKLEHGPVSGWDYELSDANFANKYVLPYLKPTTKLKKHYKMITMHKDKQYFLFWSLNINTPIYYLSNGMTFVVRAKVNGYPYIVVDINGSKAPNMVGIDGFCFNFNRDLRYSNSKQFNSLKFTGQGYTIERLKTDVYSACSREVGGMYYAGAYCGALIMSQGWQITDDYPWGNRGLTPKED